MLERSQSFDVQGKTYDDIQNFMQNILEKKFSFSTKIKRLGRSLLRISFFDNTINQEQQRDNRITILQEPDNRVYIQIKGKLTDDQVRQLWNEFKNKFNSSIHVSRIEKPQPSKEEIVDKINRLIELKGYPVKKEEVHSFVDNFIEKFNKLPEENELHSIVKGYIIMTNEDHLLRKAEASITSEPSSESLESVLEIIEDNETLNSNNNGVMLVENPIGRRKCPSCGDEASIHEMVDKSIILMHYPRIYGKKKYCGLCGYEWK